MIKVYSLFFTLLFFLAWRLQPSAHEQYKTHSTWTLGWRGPVWPQPWELAAPRRVASSAPWLGRPHFRRVDCSYNELVFAIE